MSRVSPAMPRYVYSNLAAHIHKLETYKTTSASCNSWSELLFHTDLIHTYLISHILVSHILVSHILVSHILVSHVLIQPCSNCASCMHAGRRSLGASPSSSMRRSTGTAAAAADMAPSGSTSNSPSPSSRGPAGALRHSWVHDAVSSRRQIARRLLEKGPEVLAVRAAALRGAAGEGLLPACSSLQSIAAGDDDWQWSEVHSSWMPSPAQLLEESTHAAAAVVAATPTKDAAANGDGDGAASACMAFPRPVSAPASGMHAPFVAAHVPPWDGATGISGAGSSVSPLALERLRAQQRPSSATPSRQRNAQPDKAGHPSPLLAGAGPTAAAMAAPSAPPLLELLPSSEDLHRASSPVFVSRCAVSSANPVFNAVMQSCSHAVMQSCSHAVMACSAPAGLQDA
jgi:hypothetical protein